MAQDWQRYGRQNYIYHFPGSFHKTSHCPHPQILSISWITLATGQLPIHWIHMQLPTLQPKEDVYCQHVKYGSNRSVAKTRLTCAMLAICFTATNLVMQVTLRNCVLKGHLIKSIEFLQFVEKPNGFWTMCNQKWWT
jgi:hypothetical protein